MQLPQLTLPPTAQFDKQPTLPILLFELFILVCTVAVFVVLPRLANRVPTRYLTVALGVLIFEMFTAPMWHNEKLGQWAYIYLDVSWVLTLGWSTLVLSIVTFVDALLKRWREWQRFLAYLCVLTPLVILFEWLVIGLGIRSYSPEVLDVIGSAYLPGLGVPADGLYYVPVFMSLVIAFYKYWMASLGLDPAAPPGRVSWLRRLVITFIGVFLFEVMIEPMVMNERLPQWTYIYRNISLLITGMWVVIIWLSTWLVDRLASTLGLAHRFAAYLILITIIAVPIEGWLIANEFRVYGPTATANFVGIRSIVFDLPVEVIFAIPMYMALVICFVRYWEGITTGFEAAPQPSLAPQPSSA